MCAELSRVFGQRLCYTPSICESYSSLPVSWLEARSRPRLPASLFWALRGAPRPCIRLPSQQEMSESLALPSDTPLTPRISHFWLDLHWLQCGHRNLRKVYPNKVYYINTTNANKVYYIKPQISRLAGLCLSFSELGMEEKGSLTSPILTPNSCLIFQK